MDRVIRKNGVIEFCGKCYTHACLKDLTVGYPVQVIRFSRNSRRRGLRLFAQTGKFICDIFSKGVAKK